MIYIFLNEQSKQTCEQNLHACGEAMSNLGTKWVNEITKEIPKLSRL